MYALFKGGVRVSKWYPHRIQALVHAYEHHMVYGGRGWVGCTATIKHIKGA